MCEQDALVHDTCRRNRERNHRAMGRMERGACIARRMLVQLVLLVLALLVPSVDGLTDVFSAPDRDQAILLAAIALYAMLCLACVVWWLNKFCQSIAPRPGSVPEIELRALPQYALVNSDASQSSSSNEKHSDDGSTLSSPSATNNALVDLIVSSDLHIVFWNSGERSLPPSSFSLCLFLCTTLVLFARARSLSLSLSLSLFLSLSARALSRSLS